MLDEIFSLFKTQQDAQGRTLLERYLHPNNRWSHDSEKQFKEYLTDKYKRITSVFDLEAIEIFSYLVGFRNPHALWWLSCRGI